MARKDGDSPTPIVREGSAAANVSVTDKQGLLNTAQNKVDPKDFETRGATPGATPDVADTKSDGEPSVIKAKQLEVRLPEPFAGCLWLCLLYPANKLADLFPCRLLCFWVRTMYPGYRRRRPDRGGMLQCMPCDVNMDWCRMLLDAL